ncbi:RNA polymerase sigma factor [Flagellimonas sp.]|uniref:RNA polymerase sigma factor n=1 Tax=Flagellimonas sp. TaxID=2058762 RepID=UPI003BA91FCA
METEIRFIHKELVEGSKSGNREAQYKLYNLYVGAMFNIGMRMLYSKEDAEDVVQESFVDAFTNLGKFKYDSSFGYWLKRIVINNCINHLKRQKVETTPFKNHEFYLHKVEDPEEVIMDVNQIKVGIGLLPKGYKQIIVLYLIEGYTHDEIAGFLSISPSTSKSQYHRAKKKLLHILKDL